MLTFIFANVFQGEGQAGVLPLDDANLSECTFSHDAQESEMVEVDCCGRGGVSMHHRVRGSSIWRRGNYAWYGTVRGGGCDERLRDLES